MNIRPAHLNDVPEMVLLINEIIAIGGTTANTTPYTTGQMTRKMLNGAALSSWIVAEQDGILMGFQYFQPHPDLPDDAPSIATFVRVGAVQIGIGSALFVASVAAAKALGYKWLNATIRGDNEGGQKYYASRGFEIWDVNEDAVLDDGTPVTKISRRFDL